MKPTLLALPRLMEDTDLAYFAMRRVHLPIKFEFKTAKGLVKTRESLIIEAHGSDGLIGYGEDVAFTEPFYTAETLDQSEAFIRDLAVPYLYKVRHELRRQGLRRNIAQGINPYSLVENMDAPEAMAAFEIMAKEFPMALAGIEAALLDLAGQQQGWNAVEKVMGQPLQDTIPEGIVLGDMPLDQLISMAQDHVNRGCRRIKLKVKPADGVARTRAVRNAFPRIDLAVDANGSYDLTSWHDLEGYDDLALKCIEEPFPSHMKKAFQEVRRKADWNLRTPICLDESVLSLEDLKEAHDHGCIDVLNIKLGRLGGLHNVKEMISYCRDHHIAYWVGSMVESSISKTMHTQLAALGDSYMAGDLSDSTRYFPRDLTQPQLTFVNGMMSISKDPGLGATINEEQLDFCSYTHTEMSW